MTDLISTELEATTTIYPFLLITRGMQQGTIIALQSAALLEKPLVFGRLPGPDGFTFQTEERRISRLQFFCGYRADDAYYSITPHENASNPTRLNGEIFAGETPLMPGDTISCGEVELVYIEPIEGAALPLKFLRGQTERLYLEDSVPGIARLEVISSSVPYLPQDSFYRLTPRHNFLFGRMPQNDVWFDQSHHEISRRHCEILWVNDGYIIRDLGAPNPAWVQNQRLDTPRHLEDGTSLQIGPVLMRYRAPRLPYKAGSERLKPGFQAALLRPVPSRLPLQGDKPILIPADKQVLIGRGDSNDLQLVHTSVSRRHAQLFHEAQRYFITDQGAANGTVINGKMVDGAAVLNFGDHLKFGEFEFTFEEFASEDFPEDYSTAVLTLVQPQRLDLNRTYRPTETQLLTDIGRTTIKLTAHELEDAHNERELSQPLPAIAQQLRQIPPFNELDMATFNKIALYFREQKFKAGEVLAKEGQNRGAFFVILEGKVAVSRLLNDRQRLVLCELEQPAMYGERSIFADQPFANRIQALTATRVLRLNETSFMQDLAKNRAVQTFFREQVARSTADNWLSTNILMRKLLPATRADLAQRLRSRTYQPGDILARQGEPAEEFILVLGGIAEVFSTDSHQKETMLATMAEGDTFGDSIGAPTETYPLTLRARNLVEGFVLTRADFQSALDKFNDPAKLDLSLVGLPISAMLSRVKPFDTMPPQVLTKIASLMRPKHFFKGEPIVRQDDPASGFYIISKGKVEVSFRTSEGEVRPDMKLGPGEYFGEASLFTNTRRTATVKAVEDTELLVLHRNNLDEVLRLGEGFDLANHFAENINLGFRPKKMPGALISEDTNASGELYYLLSTEDCSKFFRLSERNRFMWDLMDGDNSLNDLSFAYYLEYKQFDIPGVKRLVSSLQAAGFLVIPAVDKNLVGGTEQKPPSLLGRILNWQVEIKNIDSWFKNLYEFGGQVFFWKPVFWLLTSLMLVGFSSFLFWGLFDHRADNSGVADKLSIVQIFQGAGAGALSTPGTLPFWAILLALLANFIVHEVAHGLAVKAYNRRVISGGFGWRYTGPYFFVNTNEMWRERRIPRIVVNLAGPYSNAFIAGFCCLLMFLTPSSDLRIALFQLATVALMLAYININPLLELDGYFALMDWLEIPGLRRKAFSFVRKKLTGKPVRRPPTAREQRIFWWFAGLTPVYLVFTMIQFLFFLLSVLGSISLLDDLQLNWIFDWVLPLAITAVLAYPLIVELIQVGRDEEEQEGSARKLRQRRAKL